VEIEHLLLIIIEGISILMSWGISLPWECTCWSIMVLCWILLIKISLLLLTCSISHERLWLLLRLRDVTIFLRDLYLSQPRVLLIFDLPIVRVLMIMGGDVEMSTWRLGRLVMT
jgi:hypothetical protein